MSHSTVLVVLTDAAVAEHGVDEALALALAPFDENKDTPRYIKQTKAEAIAAQRAYFETVRDRGAYAEYAKDPDKYRAQHYSNTKHLAYISEEFPAILARLDDEEFLYQQATEWETLDEDGNITSTYNPKSKWDWYTVGGRWAGRIMNWTDTVHHPAQEKPYKQEAWDERVGGEDILQKRDLNEFAGTFAFLSAAGEWQERGRMGWWGMVADEKEPDAWDATLKQLVEDVADDDWLVNVDVHI